MNLLGVGLHSYGFTSGISTALWTYYWIQWGIVGIGGVTWLLERVRATATQTPPRERERAPERTPERLSGGIGGVTT